MRRSAGARLAGEGFQRVVVGYQPRTRHAASRLVVSVKVKHPYRHSIAPKGLSYVWVRFLGISGDFQTGDPRFDAQYYLEEGELSSIQPLVQQARARQALLKLFGATANAVELCAGEARAVFTPFDANSELTPEFTETIARHLLELVAVLESQSATSGSTDPKLPGERLSLLAWGVGFAAVGATAFTFNAFSPLEPSRLFTHTLPYSLALAVGASGLGLWGCRQRTRRALRIFGLVAVLFLGGVATGTFGANAWNEWADDSTPQTFSARVVEKRAGRVRRGQRMPGRVLWVQSWRQDGTLPLRVDRESYEAAIVGQSVVHVTTSRGRLGFEWVKSYRLEK